MIRFGKIACVAAILASLSGCASVVAVPAGPLALAEKHQIVLNREWSDISALVPQRNKKVRVLTIDGPLLNRLYIAGGLESGEGLLRSAAKEHPIPTFHADMAPTELVEFIADSLAAAGYQRLETSGLRPAKIGSSDALRFDIVAKSEGGLELNGTAEVATISGKLYAFVFIAPTEHYYATSLPDVEAALAAVS